MTEPPHDPETERLLALLESQHDFPGRYTFKVIYRAEQVEVMTLVEALQAGTGLTVPVQADKMRSSSGGKFGSVSFDIEVQSADQVLEVYRVLREIEGVVSYF